MFEGNPMHMPSRRARGCRFVLAVATIACVWVVILPWLASRPSMAEHIRWLEAKGIDAGAMYYTELEAMQPILQKLERPNSSRQPQ